MHKSIHLTLLVFLALLIACGGSSTPSTTPTPNSVDVKLNVTTAVPLVNQSTQFTANVPVNWSVTEKNGGTITSAGLYTAPANIGSFHVVATSKGDSSKTATAVVNISAQFLSLQQLPNGTNQPWSVTPMLTVINPDGSFTTANVIDTSTNQPVETNAYDIYLSPDGSKAVATVMTEDPECTISCYVYNIVLADTKTLQITFLTHNEKIADHYVQDWGPQFSPDGKAIIYAHLDVDEASFEDSYSVRKMNADGSNVQTVFGQPGVWIRDPSFSPDGKLIAVETNQTVAGVGYDGVATMNADGTNLVQLTGHEANSSPCWGLDRYPTFTPDSKKIVFSRECWPDSGGNYGQLYIMNVDGTGVSAIHGASNGGYIAFQPRILTSNHIIFSSNETMPGTDAFDMWSMAADGSKPTQIMINNVYDGFSVDWMNYKEETPSVRAFRAHSPLQQRLEHKKMLEKHRAR